MPTTLAAGDIAIVGFSSDTTGPIPKSLSFVILRDVEAGTAISYTDNGWFAARPSGTEDVYKVYAESLDGPERLERIVAEAEQIVADALEG